MALVGGLVAFDLVGALFGPARTLAAAQRVGVALGGWAALAAVAAVLGIALLLLPVRGSSVGPSLDRQARR
jgi:hypothetical protein